jgi:quinone-modifying oxidoreductase subunit QmoC
MAHLLVFYSFAGLAITTTLAIVYLYGFGYESPYPLYDPLKIIGNISAIALLYGITLVVGNRLKNSKKAGKGSYFDWMFITVVAVIAFIGMGAQLFRLADIAILAYPTYFAHLVFVFFLFAYAPFSKMAHMVYRTTAMVFARHTNRELGS